MKKTTHPFRKFRLYIRRLANMSYDTDIEATVGNITKDIEFRGANVWILFFAVIVASVGLNVNSTAVIIGAMLISPLMGPITGVGFSVGTNDYVLLRHSLKNLLVMVLISLTASTAYFFVSPLSDAQSELLARTSPTVYDVFIAFFGGFAGIVASSRKGGKITVVSGVAIATALMPPLCTAGFGLATGQWNYFIGAFYLFFINSFFIALATFIMVRYLRFPSIRYVDAAKQKLVKRSITIFAVIVIAPSAFMAWQMIEESRFNSQTIRYINDIQKEEIFEDVEIINVKRNYSAKEKEISLSIIGRELEQKDIEKMQNHLLDYGLLGTKLSVKQTGGSFDVKAQSSLLGDIFDRKDDHIRRQDSIIRRLNEEQSRIKLLAIDQAQLTKEIAVAYPNAKRFSILDYSIYTDIPNGKSDTVPTLLIEWKNPEKTKTKQQLNDWLKIRLKVKKLKIVEMKSLD